MNQEKSALKIMQIAPFALPIKQEISYGGIERVIRDLDKGFIKKNNNSIIVGLPDSKIKGKLCPISVESSFAPNIKNSKKFQKSSNQSANRFEIYAEKALEYILNEKPDVIHDHLGIVKSNAFQKITSCPPILFTLHGPINQNDKEILDKIKSSKVGNKVFFNAISKSQKEYFSKITNVDYMVYNATDVENTPYGNSSKGHIFSFGLVNSKKGTDIALDAARQLNKKIIIAGPIHDFNQNVNDFWNKKVKPKLDYIETQNISPGKISEYIDNFMDSKSNSIYIGEINGTQRKEWVKNAEAFYFPIRWQEPFGLVMIESMVGGTPVVAYSGGAVPEVIKHGKTGFVVEQGNFDSFLEYAKRIKEIQRQDCRDHVAKNFAIETQTQNYLNAYKDMIQKTN